MNPSQQQWLEHLALYYGGPTVAPSTLPPWEDPGRDPPDPPQFIRTRIIILSDTYGLDRDLRPLVQTLSTQEADVAIHCGGLTGSSDIDEYNSAIDLLATINAPLKLVIPGKTDFSLYAEDDLVEDTQIPWMDKSRELFTEARRKHQIILHEKAGTHEVRLANGAYLRYFVAPYTPEPYLDARFVMEEETDIAVTYVPPYAILDQNAEGRHIGSPELLGAIATARPSLHCFGQAHESWGERMGTWVDDEEAEGELLVEDFGGVGFREQGPQGGEAYQTLFINASTMDTYSQLCRPCCVVDLHLPGRTPEGWHGKHPSFDGEMYVKT